MIKAIVRKTSVPIFFHGKTYDEEQTNIQQRITAFPGVHVPPDSDLCSGLRVVTSTFAIVNVTLMHSPSTKWKSRWHSHICLPLLITRHLWFLPHCSLSSEVLHDFDVCTSSLLSEKNHRQYFNGKWITVDPEHPAFFQLAFDKLARSPLNIQRIAISIERIKKKNRILYFKGILISFMKNCENFKK